MRKLREAGHLRLGVMASGRGSNFDAICAAIERKELDAGISILISDRKDAAVLEKARTRGIPAVYINPRDYSSRDEYEKVLADYLLEKDVDLVVLAGYMRLIGKNLLSAFKHRVINIHPALLPSFPGLHAQKQALAYGVRYSGCTVHIVDEGMDSGPIIMQAVVPLKTDDDEESLTARILEQEHQIYWQSLQLFAEGRVCLDGRKIYIKDVEEEALDFKGGY